MLLSLASVLADIKLSLQLGCSGSFAADVRTRHWRRYMPKLGYKVRAHLMNKMVPGLSKGATAV